MDGLEKWYMIHWNNTTEEVLFLNQNYNGTSP